LYDASYFEAARSLRIRSILGVCEEFEDKADAKRAASDGFFSLGQNSQIVGYFEAARSG